MVKIGLISDVHMRNADVTGVQSALERITDRFNDGFRPDTTIVLGDLIEDEGTERADLENVRRVTGVLDDLDSPVTYLRGNHDVVNLSRETLDDELNDPWGHISVDDAAVDLLYLDSSAPRLPDARGELDQEQLTFLDEALDRSDDAVVFVHHPIHYHPIDENYWFAEHPERAFCGNKREVHDVIEAHDAVSAVFNGHLHEFDHTTYHEVDHFTINAVNKELPDADVTGTYAEVTIGDRVEVRTAEDSGFERTIRIPR